MSEDRAGEAAALLDLDAAECVDLLRGQEVGRLAVSDPRGPVVHPVNYAMVDDIIVVRLHTGTLLSAADGSNVSFQVDDINRVSHSGWSVLVHCLAEKVTPLHSPQQIDASQSSPSRPWAPGEREELLRLIPHSITGRRIRPAGTSPFQPGAYL